MALIRVRLLQIGDIHYPQAIGTKADLDLKDPGVSNDFVKRLALSPFQAVVRKLQSVLDEGNIDAVTLMGDFTTRGSKPELHQCLEFLSSALWNRTNANLGPGKYLAVPGNHDVNRDDAKNADLTFKFRYINDAFVTAGLSPVNVDEGHRLTISKEVVQLPILGLNTCVGCGTMRSFPERIRMKVEAIYEDALTSTTDPSKIVDLKNDLYEELDTPAVSQETIDWALKQLEETSSVGVICGHHNLLPQTQPRIAPYTELVNSGYLRTALLAAKRRVIYLHGHTHTDPIDVISSPRAPGAIVASIGAPQFTDGFNLIEIDFSDTGGVLGCIVKQYRYSGGTVSVTRELAIPLSINDLRATTDNHITVITAINESEIIYWRNLQSETKLPTETLKTIVQELMWKGQIEVNRKDSDDPVRWIITRNY